MTIAIMNPFYYELYLKSLRLWICPIINTMMNLPSDLFVVHNLIMVSLISNVMALLIITPYKIFVHGFLLDSS